MLFLQFFLFNHCSFRYPSDDISKLLWPIRIGSGVFPEIREDQYLSQEGQYTVGPGLGRALAESLAYKLCYYRFADMTEKMGLPRGYDRVRQTQIGEQDIDLEYFEEAFTSQNMLMRIYRVKKEANVDAGVRNRREVHVASSAE
jgi:dolichyl-diphosphooligosaccharide---protein glycosyltransferase